MSTKKVTEVVIGILLLLVEIIVVIVYKYSHVESWFVLLSLTQYLVIFTNIDVIYGVFLILLNSKTDESHQSNKKDEIDSANHNDNSGNNK